MYFIAKLGVLQENYKLANFAITGVNLVWIRLPIDISARVGVIHMDDILVVDDFVKKAVSSVSPTTVAVPSSFQVGNATALPRGC